jgi:tetratricopeptide (TPR) repeat protein
VRCPLSIHALLHAAFVLALSSGCVTANTAPASPSAVAAVAPSAVRLPSTIVAPGEALPAADLVALGKLDYDAQRFEAALLRFERVIRSEPRGSSTPEATYYAALSHEELGRHERAAVLFSGLSAETPLNPFTRNAGLRALRLWVFLERYDAAEQVADSVLQHFATELAPQEQVAAYSAQALALVQRAELERAEYLIGKGRSVLEAHRLDAAGAIPRDLAQLFFALGESKRLRAAELRFNPAPADFALAFEKRAQLVLDAQGAYSDVMRAEDAHWTAMAGTRIGEVYEQLHQDVMAMPRPAAVDERLAPLFDGAVRLRYLVLLQKGLNMLEHTVAMAERTGERSAWAARAQTARERLAQRVEKENQAIESLPYSRDDLNRVLLQVQRRQGKAPSGQ